MHWFVSKYFSRIKVIFRFYVLQGVSQVPVEAEGTEWNVRLCTCNIHKSRSPTGANCSAWNLLGTKDQVVIVNINVILQMYANMYIMPLGPGVLLWETDCLLFWGSALLFHKFQRPAERERGSVPKVETPCRSVWECLFACFLKGSLLPHHFLHCQESAHELRLEPLAQRLHEAVVANVVNETIHLNGKLLFLCRCTLTHTCCHVGAWDFDSCVHKAVMPHSSDNWHFPGSKGLEGEQSQQKQGGTLALLSLLRKLLLVLGH